MFFLKTKDDAYKNRKLYAVSMPVVILKEKHTQSFLQGVVKGLEDDVGMMLWNAPVPRVHHFCCKSIGPNQDFVTIGESV